MVRKVLLSTCALLLPLTLVVTIGAGTAQAAIHPTPILTSPPPGPLNDNTGIQSSPVSCGSSDPNGPFTFAPGLVGTIEPSTSMTLPSGSSNYYYVGSDDGTTPVTAQNWSEDLGVVASYSGNKSISIGQSASDAGSFNSNGTTNVAIAGIGVTGYTLVHKYTASTSSNGTSLSLNFTTTTGDLVLVVYGGEGVGLIQQSGVALTTLLNDTYSECGSNVIASTAMFGAFLHTGSYISNFSATTYPTNGGTAAGAVAYVFTPPSGVDCAVAPSPYVNLSGCNLSGVNFAGVNLTDAVLVGTNFTGANLTNANLTGANLTAAILTNATFTGAVLTDALLIRVAATGAIFIGAVLIGVNFTSAVLAFAVFIGATLNDAFFFNASLRFASFRNAFLIGVVLRSTDVSGVDFSFAVLTDSSWRQCTFTGAIFVGAVLIGAYMRNAVLSGLAFVGVNFTSADLDGALLDGTDLENADFYDAHLIEADLNPYQESYYQVVTCNPCQPTNITGATFQDAVATQAVFGYAIGVRADFTDAVLLGAVFSYANMTSAVFTSARLKAAVFSFANLTNALFIDARLVSANFTFAILVRANFTSALATRAIFAGVIATSALFIHASLRFASFRFAVLSFAVFTSAILVRADFTSAVLVGAYFVDANLSYATFVSANLLGAILTSAKLHLPVWVAPPATCPDGSLATVNGCPTGVQNVTARAVSDHVGYCAILSSGGVQCWGNDTAGQLGDASLTTSDVPETVVGLGGFGQLSLVANLYSDDTGYCALLTSGAVDCWGDNTSGELGNGNYATSDVPVAVSGMGGIGTLTNVVSMASDNSGYCALLSSGAVDCWGDNTSGELGNNSMTISNVPVAVSGLGGAGTLGDVTSLTSDGTGSYCAVLSSGAVDCWGNDTSGQLGNGSMTTSDVPVQVSGVGGVGVLTGVASTSSDGADSYCALLTSGAVDCWGANTAGELGNATMTGSDVPVQVSGVGGVGTLSGVASLASNNTFAQDSFCAVLVSGEVDCWGDNTSGQLGNGTMTGSDVPVQVSGVGGIGLLGGVASATSDGNDSYCGLLTSGGVDCWGFDTSGQLGDGAMSNSDVPMQVEGVGGIGLLTNIASVVGNGDQNYCSVSTAGRVDCWGFDTSGQLGDGTVTNADVPEPVVGLG